MCCVCMQSPCDSRCPNADEPEVVFQCLKCNKDIYEGDDYHDIDGEPWCEDCVRNTRKVAVSND